MSASITLPLFLLCSLFFLSLSSSLTLPSDVAALQAFKSSVKPATILSYSCLGSWNFSSDPCASPRTIHFICGVNCDTSVTPFRITQITLDPAGYSGTLTPVISKISGLVVLDLSDNNFFGNIPSFLSSSLSNLQTLTLRSNSFSGSIPSSIGNLKSLKSLDLSRNSLSGYLPNSIVSLSSLRRIDLSYNKLTGSIPKLPSNLLELAIKANNLMGSLSKSTFDLAGQLEVIELSENSFSGTLQGWFFLLPSLQQVDLANNSITQVEIWKPIDGESDLVAVDLGFNNIEGNLPVNLSSYPILSSLSLRYNRLHGSIPGELAKKGKLKRLFLDGNFLNGSPPKGLFSSKAAVSGSLGDNCLRNCPVSSELCLKLQKPTWVCKQAYGGKPKS